MGSAKKFGGELTAIHPCLDYAGRPAVVSSPNGNAGPSHRRSSDVATVNSWPKREAAHRVMRGFSFLWTSAAFQMQQA